MLLNGHCCRPEARDQKAPRFLSAGEVALRGACAKNATRFAVGDAISARTGLPVSRFSGGRTKWNRTQAGPPKTHANDAASVGPTGRVAGAVRPS